MSSTTLQQILALAVSNEADAGNGKSCVGSATIQHDSQQAGTIPLKQQEEEKDVGIAETLCSLSKAEIMAAVNAATTAPLKMPTTTEEGGDIDEKSSGNDCGSSSNTGNCSTPETVEEEKAATDKQMKGKKKGSSKRRSPSKPISIQVPNQSSLSTAVEGIYEKANFASFTEFNRAFEEWKQLYHHPFRVASSEKHEDPELEARFKYRYVVYHCSRYGEPRKRGAGRRPHQNYLPCGCNAKLRVNFHPHTEGGALCVTTLVTEHNHAPIDECTGMDGETRPFKKSKSNSTVADENEENITGDGAEFSPNGSIASFGTPSAFADTDVSALTAAAFSPLSLQPALHNSPSSGGQSSSEGANELLGGLGLALMNNGNKNKTSKTMAKTTRKSPGLNNNISAQESISQQQQQMVLSIIKNASTRNIGTTVPLNAYTTPATQCSLATTAQAHSFETTTANRMNELYLNNLKREQSQQQQHLWPLLQEFLRATAGGQLNPNESRQQHGQQLSSQQDQHQFLLALLSPRPQQSQQQQQSFNSNLSNNSNLLLSTALEHTLKQQQNNAYSSNPPSANDTSALSQFLLAFQHLNNNNNNQNKQNNNNIPSTSSGSNYTAVAQQLQPSSSSSTNTQQQQQQHLIQLLTTIGQLKQQVRTNNSNTESNNQQQQQQQAMMANVLAAARYGNVVANAEPLMECVNSTNRENLIKEAELILLVLVKQMCRTNDLAAYLRRLRQFLDTEFRE